MTTQETPELAPASGPAAAAILAAGIGTFTMGALALLAEAGLFEPPALYGPAGGLSGKAAITLLIWLIAWGALRNRWQSQPVDLARVMAGALVLIGLGLVAAFPPTWGLFG